MLGMRYSLTRSSRKWFESYSSTVNRVSALGDQCDTEDVKDKMPVGPRDRSFGVSTKDEYRVGCR